MSRRRSRRRVPGRNTGSRARAAAACLGLALVACGPESPSGDIPAQGRPPDILWIVWDTVRADRLSLYGYGRPTTPKLAAFARNARVFDDVVSAASTTVPSHASMFTGLLPSQHGADDQSRWLDDRYTTLAERLSEAGYQTYLWSSNPHVSSADNFQQGFDHEAHPWDPRYREEALRIVREKVRGDRSSELGHRLGQEDVGSWAIKAAGVLAERDLVEWLSTRDRERPWFAFVNYMEAHRPYVPPRRYRERSMSAPQIEASYRLDRSWRAIWAYTFRLRDYSDPELDLTARTYEASLMELDDLFASLLGSLSENGVLDGTVVIVTADHGELLGEHHMLDHQYALYAPLTRVPLVVRDPTRLEPGRDPRPVQSYDLFPTLLEIAGLESPSPSPSDSPAQSLLHPENARVRFAEYPAPFLDPIELIRRQHPDWDPTPFARRLRAVYDGPYELIQGEDGRHELYHLGRDPQETRDLSTAEPETTQRLLGEIEARFAGLSRPPADAGAAPQPSEEQRRLLEGLGYVVDPAADPETGEASPRD